MIEKTIDVFIEHTEKCPICGFYKSVCVCTEDAHKKFSKILSLGKYLKKLFAKIPFLRILKAYFIRFVAKDKVEYHGQMYVYFRDKSDKAHEKAMNNYTVYREIQESQIDWDKVEFEDFEIKVSNIDWDELERKSVQTKVEGVI